MTRWILAAVGVFMISWVWHLPAAYVISHLPLSKHIQLEAVQGTWHHGHGRILWEGRFMGEVHWALRGVSVLWGHPQFDLRWRQGTVQLTGQVRMRWDGLHGQVMPGAIPLDVLADLLPESLSSPVRLAQGRIQWKRIEGIWPWSAHWPEQLQGQGRWTNVMILDTPLPDISWQLHQKGSPILLSAKGAASWGEIRAQVRLTPVYYALSMTLAPAPGKQPPHIIRMALKPAANGQWQLSLKRPLQPQHPVSNY